MDFQKTLRLEAGRLIERKKAAILLIFFLLTLYFIQTGIWQYKDGLNDIEQFKEFEKTRVENFQFYLQYGTYGFRLLYVPGPLSVLFSNAGIINNNLNAFIDSGERMNIYEPFKGQHAFTGYTGVFFNLTGLLFFVGSLLSLFYGYETYKNKNFVLFIDCLSGTRKRIIWRLISARLLLLLICCTMIFMSAALLFAINGLSVNMGHLALYFLTTMGMWTFYFLLGMPAGTISNKQTSLVVAFAVWLFFCLAVPAMTGKIVHNKAGSLKSSYEMDTRKFKLLMNFEKEALDIAGKMDKDKTHTEIRRKLFDYLWDNEFREIMKLEKDMMEEMKEVVALHYNLSLISPTSFFLSVNNEISGRGYESLILFYQHVYTHKRGFVRYYANKAFFSDDKSVKPYLSEDKTIFHSPSTLPANFGFGLIFAVFWILLLLFLNSAAFDRLSSTLPVPVSAPVLEHLNPDTELKKNKTTVVVTFTSYLTAGLLDALKGRKNRFIFVPGPDCLPEDTTLSGLFMYLGLPVPERLEGMEHAYIHQLDRHHKALALLEIAASFNDVEFIIFDNFLGGLSETFVAHFTQQLEIMKKGRKIIYFTRSVPPIGDFAIRRANEQHPF